MSADLGEKTVFVMTIFDDGDAPAAYDDDDYDDDSDDDDDDDADVVQVMDGRNRWLVPRPLTSIIYIL